MHNRPDKNIHAKSNRIPRDFIQTLLTRVDIVELIDNRLPLQKKSAANFFACCPFHSEKSASFSVSQKKQFYHCFGCGAHGNALDFLMQYERLNFPEAVEALAKIAGIEVPTEQYQNNSPKISTDLYALLEKVAQFYQMQLRTHSSAIAYLKKRGLTGEIAREFGIGFAPAGWDHLLKNLGNSALLRQHLHETGMLIQKEDGHYHDRFRDRIMFPIRDRRGRVVGFGGRIVEQGEPKYLNSPETPLFHKGHELYGLYHAQKAQRQFEQILVVEGYMDVISLFQHGVTYAVATLGTAATAHHLQRLFRYSQRIIFCFDGDAAGRKAAWRAVQTIFPLVQDEHQIHFMFLPEGDDPDSFIRKQGRDFFEDSLKKAATLSQFFFQSLSAQVNLSHLDGRAQLAKQAMTYIEQLPEGIFKKLMTDELEKRTHLLSPHLKKTTRTHKAQTNARAKPHSPLRLILILLIQFPQLAPHCQITLPESDNPGFIFLHKLLTALASNLSMTTAGLREYWRGEPDESLFEKLANTPLIIPEAGIEKEFLGALKRLQHQLQKERISKLLAKAAESNLTHEEKTQLHQLIAAQQDNK